MAKRYLQVIAHDYAKAGHGDTVAARLAELAGAARGEQLYGGGERELTAAASRVVNVAPPGALNAPERPASLRSLDQGTRVRVTSTIGATSTIGVTFTPGSFASTASADGWRFVRRALFQIISMW